MKQAVAVLTLGAALTLGLTSAALGDVVWHDPWLNWDFINNLGQTVNDFAVIVDAANWTPQQQWSVPFPTFATSQVDWDGDGTADDTMCKWSGADVVPNQIAHGGLYMLGSGFVLDAYWTKDCNKVGPSTPITYEKTEIRGDPEVHMHLMIAPGFYDDTSHPSYPHQEAGWTHIRTFVNIPADLLGLEDLTRDLDLDWLAAQPGVEEVTPKKWDGEKWVNIGYEETIMGVPDSFFDIFLAEIPPEKATDQYEALLHADVVNQPQIVGQFWNLNPQSPEPATLALLAVGGSLIAILRRRR